MPQDWSTKPVGLGDLDAPAQHAAAVTPNDAGAVTARALYIGVTGNVTVDTVGGEANVLFSNVPVGILPVMATRVYATGTTASSIVAIW